MVPEPATSPIAVTVDVVLFANVQPPEVLLIQRGHPPFAGQWALPGGFVETDERVAVAAARELAEEAGINTPALTFFGYFDDIDRARVAARSRLRSGGRSTRAGSRHARLTTPPTPGGLPLMTCHRWLSITTGS